jgi:GTP-binding protein EngB required for normal cell division
VARRITPSDSPDFIGSLVDRVEALRRFADVTHGHLPEEMLAPARIVCVRAGERLALSRDHTVVALAGATGSGKSSLFNAIAGVGLSTVGVRRPTTDVAHACVWGHRGASELLDWLGVPRRFMGENTLDGDDQQSLRGLVLLDLPDFDSVESAHRVEVDRLLELVDLVVWVLDPQKYADKVLHKQYLSQFHRHRDITVVVLNQSDLLAPADVERCLNDLRGLLESDGLTGVPLLATSAVDRPGLAPLQAVLQETVAVRLAAMLRLAADVDVVVADLSPLVRADAPRDAMDRATVRELTDALANAAGVPLIARATERAYVHRGMRSTGWPLTRWLGRLRPDPLHRLRLGQPTSSVEAVRSAPPAEAAVAIGATSVPPAAPAAKAAVGLALRTVAERAGGGLPPPWPAAVLAAARARGDDLTDVLDVAIARTDLGVSARPLWWRMVGGIQWLTALVALAGLVWLGARLALFAIGLPDLIPAPQVGRLQWPTVLLFGGLLAGMLTSIVVRSVIGIAARRKASRAAARMRHAVQNVAAELVLAGVQDVQRAYTEARAALRAAAGT